MRKIEYRIFKISKVSINKYSIIIFKCLPIPNAPRPSSLPNLTCEASTTQGPKSRADLVVGFGELLPLGEVSDPALEIFAGDRDVDDADIVKGST